MHVLIDTTITLVPPYITQYHKQPLGPKSVLLPQSCVINLRII